MQNPIYDQQDLEVKSHLLVTKYSASAGASGICKTIFLQADFFYLTCYFQISVLRSLNVQKQPFFSTMSFNKQAREKDMISEKVRTQEL